ncbi:hypothetical protein [Actinomadura rudentiformis]|uniref:Uncharacterized protein n=1 Tax=Actinomadura rudentiformis TaxID=359158 RepID=A0A6H9YTA5_9ACTN|nr:hypothetical protein [Actinomadura rudentiformis]KAB2351600.1 hypothetical protein F8566_05080 [Actinomadura rudentiformis]
MLTMSSTLCVNSATRLFTPHEAAIIAAARLSSAQSATRPIYTPSVLRAAADLLAEVWAASERHGVAPADWETLHCELAPLALQARIAAFHRAPAPDIDPAELLTEVVRAAELQDGEPVHLVEAPTAINADDAYMVLGRRAETPAWGPRGDAPLVVMLTRPARSGVAAAPWEWTLAPDVPDGTVNTACVIAPPPFPSMAPTVAAEVGAIVSGVLTGAIHPWGGANRPGRFRRASGARVAR